ncbi:iron ABC transporter permease [Paenibacillus turpanensis]|uniref:iron ABC transporter permease n=1 Tax=Paenibacillus turpanensis TaxID=2689078 RepID=UPI00140E0218|nr:iron ABC transporter permease [Paenibacillus turpanensis]
MIHLNNEAAQDTFSKSLAGLRFLLVFAGGLGLLWLLLAVHITQGQAQIGFRTVMEAVFAPSDEAAHHIVRTLRMPRAVMGALAGGALAAAGVMLQTVTRNPLASSSTLGISAGAYLSVVLLTVFAPGLLASASLPVALAGGFGAAAFVFLLAGGMKAAPVPLALSGMAVTLALSAVTGALQLIFEEDTSKLFLWGAGTLIQNNWGGVLYSWPWIAGCIGAAILLSRKLDLLELDEEVAESLGQRVRTMRLTALFIAVLMAAVTVSVVGPIGFIGLIAPHAMRFLGFRRHALLLPASFLWGAVLLVGADVLARLVDFSASEMPVGAVTALIGAPWMIWLARRSFRNRAAQSGAATGGTLLQGSRSAAAPYPVLLIAAALVLAAAWACGLMFGGLHIPLREVWTALTGQGPELAANIIWDLRMPRMLVASLAGAALAVSGLLLQGVVRNPLADPSIIGITSGAGAGALTLLIIWPAMPVSLLPAAAFAGALASAAAVYALTKRSGLQPAMVALVGIAVSALGAAAIQLLVLTAQLRAAVALAWLAGSTYARGWEELLRLLPWPLLLLPLAWAAARRLNLLALSDESAIGLGLHVPRTRLWLAGIGVALAASAVATVGTVGFVGLLAPHAARLLAGPDHRRLVWLSTLLGAALLALADLLGRVVLAPKEIPSGLVVAIIGAFYFLWLMRRRRPIR